MPSGSAASAGSTADYRGGKLKLKGCKQLFKIDKNKKKINKADSKVMDEDQGERGGWRRISEELDLKGGIDIAIECGDYSKCYLAAKDNGKFTLGAKHFKYGEQPSPEEVFTLIKSPDDPKISLKTGFGKYVGVDVEGTLIATADAIGARERFDIVIQDGKTAVQSCNGLFLSLEPNDDGNIYVSSRTAREKEILNIRTSAEKKGPTDWRTNEDKLKAGQCETSYIKMYQHSRVETKNKMINYDIHDKKIVRRAQQEGNLHETLLDRRTKLKSDKYC